MVRKPYHWQRLHRKTLLESRYINLYSDTVVLPDGSTIDDYTVAKLHSGVVVVATDRNGNLITQFEYKYAIDRVILNLPSGGVEGHDSVIETARRELLEETGYLAEKLELVATLYEYPSKLSHRISIVRAVNATKVQDPVHEKTESIGSVYLIPGDAEVYEGEFNTTYNISAIALTLPELLHKRK